MVTHGELLRQGGQRHWAPDTGMKHPSGEGDNGKGQGGRLMAAILPDQPRSTSLYIVYDKVHDKAGHAFVIFNIASF